jgi:hypothetical protein
MAAPTIIAGNVAADKTSGTTLNVTVSAFCLVGDLLVVHLAMDPAAGTVTFGTLGGPELWGAYTATDITNGSGTSGVRTVVAWARCTQSGDTVSTGLTITHPSVTARAACGFIIQGTEPTIDPVIGSGHAASGTAYTTLTPPLTGLGTAIGALSLMGIESASSTAVSAGAGFNQTIAGDFTAVDDNTATSGTSGAGSASNISVAYLSEVCFDVASETVNVVSRVAESNACVGLLFAGGDPQPELAMTITTGA